MQGDYWSRCQVQILYPNATTLISWAILVEIVLQKVFEHVREHSRRR